MYFLERKQQRVLPNVLGNCSQPVYSWSWKQIAVCKERQPLEKYVVSNEYRIVSNIPEKNER